MINVLGKTGDENVQHNITKARRTAYSLFASGLHGHNGLDPLTSFYLIITCTATRIRNCSAEQRTTRSTGTILEEIY